MHVYLPDDDNHSELGTRLYSVPGNLKRQSSSDRVEILTQIPKHLESECKKEKQIPFIPGNVFIHSSTKESWHQAPMVPPGYVRKSIMFRWEYNAVSIHDRETC